jgi:hypothetical protein
LDVLFVGGDGGGDVHAAAAAGRTAQIRFIEGKDRISSPGGDCSLHIFGPAAGVTTSGRPQHRDIGQDCIVVICRGCRFGDGRSPVVGPSYF